MKIVQNITANGAECTINEEGQYHGVKVILAARGGEKIYLFRARSGIGDNENWTGDVV